MGAFVNQRVTNHQKGPSVPLRDDQVEVLRDAVGPYGNLYYTPVDHPGFDAVLDVWEEADRVRMLDPKLHRELFEELVWPERGDDLRQGLDVRTLELTRKQNRIMGLLERVDATELLSRWDLGQRLGEGARESLKASAGMVTIGVGGSGSFGDLVRGGRRPGARVAEGHADGTRPAAVAPGLWVCQ